MAIISVQYTFMRSKWEEAEKERKGKGLEGTKESEYTIHSEISTGVEVSSREVCCVAGGIWRLDIKERRLEMLLFTGMSPDEWIFRVERYFIVNQLTKMEKLETSALCFEEGALAWYQWE